MDKNIFKNINSSYIRKMRIEDYKQLISLSDLPYDWKKDIVDNKEKDTYMYIPIILPPRPKSPR